MTNEYLKLLKQILALLGVKYVETSQVEALDLSDAVLPEFRDSYLTWVETVEANKPAKTGPVPKKSQVSMLSASTDIYVLFEFVHDNPRTESASFVRIHGITRICLRNINFLCPYRVKDLWRIIDKYISHQVFNAGDVPDMPRHGK